MGRIVFKQDRLPTTGGSTTLQFKLYGDWDKTIRILNKLSPTIKRVSLEAQLKVCDKIKDKVKKHLVNQDLGWKKLSSKYKKAKLNRGLDGRTLIAWAEYYHAIESWTVGSQHLAFVGVKNGSYTKKLNGKKSKYSIAKIAAIHEFSSGKKVPRRALWKPTLQEMGGSVGIKALYIKHLIGKLRVKGIPIKDIKNMF